MCVSSIYNFHTTTRNGITSVRKQIKTCSWNKHSRQLFTVCHDWEERIAFITTWPILPNYFHRIFFGCDMSQTNKKLSKNFGKRSHPMFKLFSNRLNQWFNINHNLIKRTLIFLIHIIILGDISLVLTWEVTLYFSCFVVHFLCFQWTCLTVNQPKAFSSSTNHALYHWRSSKKIRRSPMLRLLFQPIHLMSLRTLINLGTPGNMLGVM